LITCAVEKPFSGPSAAARHSLPRIAEGVRQLGDPLLQARTLSLIAHLQARVGDLAGAIALANRMPDLERGDFSSPDDGFHDVIKPATLALIAGCAFDSGNKVEIRSLPELALVPAIEVLSPVNKSWQGRRAYLDKRD
jgi:hypothetical protein